MGDNASQDTRRPGVLEQYPVCEKERKMMYNKGKVELLKERTATELSIESDKLSKQSHTKVYVRCTRCGEIFKREFRNLHQLHSCPTYRTIGNVRHKWCNKCYKFKPTHLFGLNNDGYKSQCRLCDSYDNSTAQDLKNDITINELIDLLAITVFDIPLRCEFIKLDPRAIMPSRKLATDAGLDVYAIEEHTIPPNEVIQINTGIALVVPNGYYYTIEGRSGFWKHGIVPCRGIIDATYAGPVIIAVHNHSSVPFTIKPGERFAQLIMHRFVQVDITEVEKIDDSYSDRGQAGFGSTGV